MNSKTISKALFSSLFVCLAAIILAGCSTPANGTATPTMPTAVATKIVTTAQPPTATAPGPSPIPPTVAVGVITPTSTATATDTPLPPTDTPIPTPTATPTIPPVVIEVEGAVLLPGFSMIEYADIFRPTGLAFDAAGRLLATSFDGSVHLFEDTDNDGRAESDTIFYSNLYIPTGITVHPENGDIYVSSNSRISILRDPDGDNVATGVNFVQGLPGLGRHQNNNLKFGPDGWLYMGMGSSCDVCYEVDERNATIMRFNIATGESEIYAWGLRNSYDLAFHPVTGELFATENGRDDLGLDEPQEELNHIIQGADYGFPDCWDDLQGPDCAGTVPAIAFFEARASANSIDFYTGAAFPEVYQHQLFVAMLGSWIKLDAVSGIMLVYLTPNGDTYRGTPVWFASWDGMPLGLIEGPDGALYVGDYDKNKIYRISYGP